MAPVKTLLPAALILLATVFTACSTTAQYPSAENAAIEKDAAQEIHRICALPESQRQAEIQKIRVASGVVVTCGH
jgi:hypothetical protein